MTREEEIKKAAKDNEPKMIKNGDGPRDFFRMGADWSYAHSYWIKPEDNLPEVGVKVLICVHKKNHCSTSPPKKYDYEISARVPSAYICDMTDKYGFPNHGLNQTGDRFEVLFWQSL